MALPTADPVPSVTVQAPHPPLPVPEPAAPGTTGTPGDPGMAPASQVETAPPPNPPPPAVDPQLLAAAAILAQQGMPSRRKRRRSHSSDSSGSSEDSQDRRHRRHRRRSKYKDTESLFLQMERRLDASFQRRIQEQEQKQRELMAHEREVMNLRLQSLTRSRSPSEHSRASRDPTPTSPLGTHPWRATAAPRYGEAFRNRSLSPPTLSREDPFPPETSEVLMMDPIVIKDEPSSEYEDELEEEEVDITSIPGSPSPEQAVQPPAAQGAAGAAATSGPLNASAIAEAAAKIDQQMCRSHVKGACQLLKKEHGRLTDHTYESNFATGLPSATFYRDHGMVPSPEERVAWPHLDALDHTQRDNIASLQQQQGTTPAEDLFSLPPPRSADKFLPLPAKKIKKDMWYYMSQSATDPSWSVRAPQGSIVDPGAPTPKSYSLPHSQMIAQESNLRLMSHLAGMTNMASVALGAVIFELFTQGLLPDFPIHIRGMDEPLTFEWFLSMLQLMGSSTTQLAHNAVSAAMNLQTIRREAFIAVGRTGVSPDDRERLRVSPMDSEDLFGQQAKRVHERKEKWRREGPSTLYDRNAAVIVREVVRSRSDNSPRPSSSQQGAKPKKKGGKKKKSGQAQSQGRQQPAPTFTPPQPFRAGAGRGQSPAPGRGRGNGPPKRGGGAGRGAGRGQPH